MCVYEYINKYKICRLISHCQQHDILDSERIDEVIDFTMMCILFKLFFCRQSFEQIKDLRTVAVGMASIGNWLLVIWYHIMSIYMEFFDFPVVFFLYTRQ